MSFSFGFSKTKQKTTLVQAKLFTNEQEKQNEDRPELITSIQDKKVKSTIKTEPKKLLVIPCQKNQSLIDSLKHKKSKQESEQQDIEIKFNSEQNSDDVEAIKELLKSAKGKNEKKETELKIPINESDEKSEVNDLSKIEEPNYEAIDLEQFGKAALRGMGWNEKEGIGLLNKRSFGLVEVELRPKGLGLGAGFGKKQKLGQEEEADDKVSKLKYVKGCYIEVLQGEHKNKFGQLVSFDDGLNRILVKLFDDNQTISILQNLTRLISKSDYEIILKNKKR